MHDTTELPRPELCHARRRHGLTATGLVEGPAWVRAPSCARHVRVLARRHPLRDRRQAAFKRLRTRGSRLLAWVREERQTSVGYECLLGLPTPILQSVICETPEADTGAAEEIARVEAVAPQARDHTCLAVREEASLAAGVLCLAGTVAGRWDGAGRKHVSGRRATRPALLTRRPESRPRRDHGGVGPGGGTIDRAAERTPVACQRRRQLSPMVPLPGRVVASRVWGQRIRTALELRALEQATRRGLDVLVGRLWRAMAIGHARQDWPGLVQRVVAVDAGRLHARLRGIVGRIGVASDLRHPTGDQRSRHALRARGHQAA
jgi:hypothetical protein